VNRTLAMVTAGLAVVSAVVTGALWNELHEQRQRNAGLQPKSAPATAAATPAVPLPTSLSSPNEAVPPPIVAAMPPSAPAPSAAPIPSVRNIARELLADPEYRKARIASLRASLMRNYPGLSEALRLTPEETDRFFNVMAETQVTLNEQLSALVQSFNAGQRELTQAEQAEMARTRETVRRGQADAIRELLGPSRYEQWLDYQPTRNSRMQASTFADALTEAGTPLDAGQLQSLQSAVAAEQASLKQDTIALGRTVTGDNPQAQTQAQEALRRRQSESNRRILDGVTPYLTGQQLRSLRAYVDQEETISRAVAEAQQRAKVLQTRQ
jgi:hypothetical protein